MKFVFLAMLVLGCAEGEASNDGSGGAGGGSGGTSGSGGTGGSGGSAIDAPIVDAGIDAPPCPIDGATHDCASATDLGMLALGANMSITSNLPPMGQDNWYAVAFASNTNPMYHPHVYLTTNTDNAAKFDVLSACGTALSCMGAGQATGLTDWEVHYTAGDPASPGFQAVPAVGAGGRILIRVFRSTAAAGCDMYSITIAN
jgi:hypothetical protein